MEKYGYKTGLYCSYDWVKNYVDGAKLANYDKWIAQYASNCSYNGNDLAMWQYSSKGTVPGISGRVDMNYCYKDYASTPKPASPSSTSSFSVGQKVKLISGAKYVSGNPIPAWVVNSTLYVRQISGDNVVISTQLSGAVTGVVNKSQIVQEDTAQYKITVDRLNIRSAPNTSSKVLGTAKKGEVYTVIKEQNNWGQLKNNGWISLEYAKKI